jgi:CHAT domain-containing protein/Tfp pilus assembly protein PilF
VPRDTTVLGRRADSLFAGADSLRKRRDVAAAMRRYRQALALYRRVGDREGQADAKNEIGILHAYQDRRDQALSALRAARRLYRDLGMRAEGAKCLNNIAILHKRDGSYEEALRAYREALEVFRALGSTRNRAVTLSNMALVYERQGAYDESRRRHEEALRTYRALDDSAGIARSLDNIGDVQVAQGQYRKALTNFRAALRVHRALGNKRESAGAQNGIGRVQFWRYQYEEALSNFRTAVEMHRALGDRSAVAGNLNDIGLVYQKQGRYDQAETVLTKALRIHRDIDDRYSTAITLRSLGDVERARQNYEEALPRYRDALRISRALENAPGVAHSLDGIGNIRLAQGRLAAADSILRRSVRLTEELLRTASGAERRDYLAKEIDRFHALVTTQVRAGRPEAALRTLERSRARLLAERLSDDQSPAPSIPSVDVLQGTLGAGEAAVLYANTDTERPLTAFVVTRRSVRVREVPDSTVLRRVRRRYESALARLRLQEEIAMGPTQGASLLRRAKGVRVGLGTEGTLANLIRLYRHDLAVRPENNVLSAERRRRLGTALYDLLIRPLEEMVSANEELVVVPDGALGYLPFETLYSRSGEWLVEHWQVRYVQSLRTLRLLRARERPTSPPPSLLALGGAVYDPTTYEADTAAAGRGGGPPEQAPRPTGYRVEGRPVPTEEARRNGYRWLDRGRDPVEGYRRLGLGPDRWRNLPGTLREARALGRIATPSTVLVGMEASEHRIRRLSTTGELGEYRVVHFATHGFVVPERPPFSALVLADVGRGAPPAPAGNPATPDTGAAAPADGYLNMREIADLDLAAELVVLSACRTGLGRIYRGSGAVSLAQAFLRAGAGSAAVSMWAVYDRSTSRFMQAVYRRAWGRDTSWTEAIAQTKRAFIDGHHGERLRAPRFWAPFVHYGQSAGATGP